MERSFKKNKKGISGQIMLLIVMAIILIAIVLMVYIFTLIGAPLQSIMQDTSGILSDTMQSTNDPDLINASQASFEPALRSLNNLEWFSYTIAIMAFLVFLIMCFYVRVYPFLIFIWIVLIIVLLALSLYLTSAYQGLASDDGLGGYYTAWENTDFMLKNLPFIILILGIGGGIIMFMLASKEQSVEAGGGGPL